MPYSINKSDGTSVTIPDNAIDTAYYNPTANGPAAGLGIQLVGRNAINYGSAIAQNILQMTENFASANFPSDSTALQGQTWFNTTNNALYVRTTANTSGGIANWKQLLTLDSSGNSTVNGSQTINGNQSITGNTIISGNLTVGGTITGSVTSAATLTSARTISASGDASWVVSFDGSTNVTGALTLATVNATVGTYGDATHIPQFTVDAKGRITGVVSVPIAGGGTPGTGTVTNSVGPLTLNHVILGNGTADCFASKVTYTQPATAATIVFGTDNATITMPGTTTLVGQNTVDTLTNKTLNNPIITNYTETAFVPSAGSSFTVNLTNGTLQQFTTNANTTITLPAPLPGKSYTIQIAYGGAHTLTWAGGGTIKWANGVAPTATSVNGKFDTFTFFSVDSTNTFGTSGGSNA